MKERKTYLFKLLYFPKVDDVKLLTVHSLLGSLNSITRVFSVEQIVPVAVSNTYVF